MSRRGPDVPAALLEGGDRSAAEEAVLRALAAHDAAYSPVARGLPADKALALTRAYTDLAGLDLVVAPTAGPPGAIGLLAPLPFDSELFRQPMGRLARLLAPAEAPAMGWAVLYEVLRAAEARGLRHLTCRVPCADHAAVTLLQEHGFRVMTVFIGFEYPTGQVQPSWGRESGVRPMKPGDIPTIRAIARGGFSHGTRFHADPFLPDEAATALHERWAENCCARRAADEVFVAEREGTVVGFIACQVVAPSRAVPERSRGVVPLVAVAEGHRGHGVGKALVRRALAWFASQGLAFGEIGTESFNYPALNAYAGAGFQIALSAFWFHRARPEGGWLG